MRMAVNIMCVLINMNRAEGRGANAPLFYLTSLTNFIVTRVIPLHEG